MDEHTAFKIIPQTVVGYVSRLASKPGSVRGRGQFIPVRWTHGPVVRREAEKYWGNGVVLTRLLGIHTDGHAPSLEAAKAEFQASWRQWLAWAKLGEVQ